MLSVLLKQGFGNKIPDLIRNELWIRDKNRKLKKSRSRSKKKELKECSFKPAINEHAVLSPSPKYKYHDLQKNQPASYTSKGLKAKTLKENEYRLLLGEQPSPRMQTPYFPCYHSALPTSQLRS